MVYKDFKDYIIVIYKTLKTILIRFKMENKITLYISDEDKNNLEKKANAQRLSLSAYCRVVLLNPTSTKPFNLTESENKQFITNQLGSSQNG